MLQLFWGDTVLVKGKRRRNTICIVLSDDSVAPGEVHMNSCVRENLKVRLGELVSVHLNHDVQYGKNILYHNNGNGAFTDATAKAGVHATEFGTVFHTGATFFDYDRDGNLDLYAGGYAKFDSTGKRTCPIGPGVVDIPDAATRRTAAIA